MTNVKHFSECSTQDEAKNVFKKLCFALHPDHNDSPTAGAEFIELKKQYDSFTPSEGRERTEADASEALYNTIRQFENLQNVLITFVGSFIWLEDEEGSAGATKAQKEEIKKIILDGFNSPRFSGKRLKWFYSPVGYKQKFKSKKSFDEIRKTWGSKTFEAGATKNKIKQLA
jgi:DnaJ-class molecular chaperone